MGKKVNTDEDKKAPADKNSSTKLSVSYLMPSVISSIPLAITFFLSLTHTRPSTAPAMEEEFEIEEETGINYQYYLYSALTITTGIIFAITTFGNIAFGRRPSNDGHHNPLYGKLIESASDNLPLAIAIGNSVVRFISRSAAGERSDEVNHVISTASTAAVVAQRVDAIDYRLYDHAMDRSLLLDGDMRWLEAIATRIEGGIVVILELGAHSLFLLMTIGVTRINVNDGNRLYWISSIYLATTAAEDILVNIVNEEIFYLTRIADAISPALIAIKLADPAHPTHVVDPRAIDTVDKKIQNFFHGVREELKEIGETMTDGVKDAWEDVKNFFDHNKKKPSNEDDGGGKMSPEEKEAMEEEERNPQQKHTENEQQQNIEHPISQLFSEFPAIYGGLAEEYFEETHHLGIREMIADALGPDTQDAETNTETSVFFTYPNQDGSATLTSTHSNLYVNIHDTSETEASHHNTLFNRFTQHSRNVGNGIRSYHDPDGNLIILFPGGVTMEIPNHTDHF